MMCCGSWALTTLLTVVVLYQGSECLPPTGQDQLEAVSTPFCHYYNKSACLEAKAKHNQSLIEKRCNLTVQSCAIEKSRSSQAFCFAVWELGSSDPLDGLHLATCYIADSGNSQCSNDTCVGRTFNPRKEGMNVTSCCCNTVLCNGNRTVQLEPLPQTTKPTLVSVAPTSFDERTKLSLYIGIPIVATIVIVIIVVVVLMCRKHWKNYHNRSEHNNSDNALMEDDYIDQTELVPVKVQSQGRFGKVFVGGDVNGIKVAIKTFEMPNKRWWLQECEIYKLPGMQHENLSHFVGAMRKGESNNMEMWIVIEYHPNGSIYDYLKGHVIGWSEMLHMARTMMTGLAYLHNEMVLPDGRTKCTVAHRDIKSKNILLKEDLSAVIADFGLAQKFEAGMPMSDAHIQAGTHRYMAPEVLEGAISFSKDAFLRIDVYAGALVLWELLNRCDVSEKKSYEYKLPFEEEIGLHASLDVMQNLVANEKVRPQFPECLNKHPDAQVLMETIEESWDQDAEARLSAGCVESRLISLCKNSRLERDDSKLACSVNNRINNAQNLAVNEEEIHQLLITQLA